MDTIKYLCIVLALFYTNIALAQDGFLNTVDTETNSVVHGEGVERGYYVQVSFLVPEDIIPKNSKLDPSEPLSDEALQKYLNKVEPVLKFSQNTAGCHIFQGPYYNTNDKVANGTQVTVAYLIEGSSTEKDKFCKLRIYLADSSTLLREIDYFRTIEDAKN